MTVGYVWIVGVVRATEVTGYIEDLYVIESYRHRGIGTQLVYKALNFFESKEIKTVFVSVSKNDQAVGFYKKIGFIKCKGTWLYK